MKTVVGLAVAATLTVAATSALSQTLPVASSRPFTIDDLLAQEAIGSIRASPDSRWVVVEKQAAWNTAGTYKYDYYTHALLSDVEVFSSSDGHRRHALADPDHDAGFVAGPFSPSGNKMVVYRLSEKAWSMGVMTLETGAVQWLDVSPELARFGETVAWRSDTELLVVACHDHDLPSDMGLYSQSLERQRDLWHRAERGRSPSSVFTASGEARDSREKAPNSRLLRIDLATGRQASLVEGPIIDISVAPDGLSVAALMNGDDIQASADTVLYSGSAKQVRRLVIADVETGSVQEPLPQQDFASHLLAWSPGSDQMVAFARTPGGRFEDGRFWVISRPGTASALDLAGASAWLEADAQAIPIPRASWSRNGLAVQVRTPRGMKAWMTVSAEGRRSFIPQAEDGESVAEFGGSTVLARAQGLWSFDAGGAEITKGRLIGPGTRDDLGARGTLNLDPAILGRSVLIEDGGCLLSTAGRRHCLPSLPADESIVAAGPDASFLLSRRRSPGGAIEVRLTNVAGSVTLARVNSYLDDRDWGDVVPVEHQGPEGQSLRSWLLLPPAPSAGPAPLAVIAYPGNVFSSRPSRLAPGALNLHINAAILSAAGYAVLFPSLPRNTADPADFSRFGEQLISIVAAACAGQRCDSNRAALIGHSFGGTSVLRAAAQTQAFKAIVASNGSGDLSQMLIPRRVYRLTGAEVVTGTGWLEGGQASLGVPLGINPQRYFDNSAIYGAGQIHTPTLLIESELDGSGFGSLFGALYRLNREAGLVTYFGTSHEFVSPANVRDLHSRILDWLDRYLRVPDAGDPRLPVASPRLKHSQNEEPVGGGIPDQPALD